MWSVNMVVISKQYQVWRNPEKMKYLQRQSLSDNVARKGVRANTIPMLPSDVNQNQLIRQITTSSKGVVDAYALRFTVQQF